MTTQDQRVGLDGLADRHQLRPPTRARSLRGVDRLAIPERLRAQRSLRSGAPVRGINGTSGCPAVARSDPLDGARPAACKSSASPKLPCRLRVPGRTGSRGLAATRRHLAAGPAERVPHRPKEARPRWSPNSPWSGRRPGVIDKAARLSHLQQPHLFPLCAATSPKRAAYPVGEVRGAGGRTLQVQAAACGPKAEW